MAILFNQETKVFTLQTKNSAYQMKVADYGVLLHLYYGKRIDDCDLSYLIQRTDRGFCGNPYELQTDRTFSLDYFPQEYSCFGIGDYRTDCVKIINANGSCAVDYRYHSYRIEEGKYSLEGLPAFYADKSQSETLVIEMEDKNTGMKLELLYGILPEADMITRAAKIINNSSETVRVKRAMSMCLDFPGDQLDWVHFYGKHTMEREFQRSRLIHGRQSIRSERGTSSHQHNPFVMLCEPGAGEEHGLVYGAALVYSGNFLAEAERSQFETARLVLGIHPQHFGWSLAPGEQFIAPEAALVCSPNGFAGMTHRWHAAMRECLIRDPLQGARRPVLVNNWEATEFHFTAQRLVEIAREGAALGAELFVMDDGWFGKRDDDRSGLGDWVVNPQKLPGGLGELVRQVNGLGMQFGIWVEPEMVSEDSELYRAHPDWALGAPGRPQTLSRSQLVLDFTRREVRDCIYAALCRVLDSAPIAYVKWDVNRSLSDVWSAALPAARQGEVFHRYILGVYEMMDRLRRDYPQILLEGCAGGGGRFDAGMLYYAPQIWCSDNTDAIDRLRIQYGTSFCYPVCAVGSHVSAVPNVHTGRTTSIETRGVVAMSGTFGYEMDLGRCTEAEKQAVRRQIKFFKQHCRLIQQGVYDRLSAPDDAFTAWQQTAPDGGEALVSVVWGPVHAAGPFCAVRLRSLAPNKRYRVNGGAELYTGAALMTAGLPLPLPKHDYQAWQFYLQAEEG